MNKSLFLRIVNRLTAEVPYFRPKKDATFRDGVSPLQQCTAAIRLLAYGGAADGVDEYIRIGETTARECLEHFVVGIVDFIDCMHWKWKNCPTAWKGMYSRGTDKPTIVLEAVASEISMDMARIFWSARIHYIEGAPLGGRHMADRNRTTAVLKVYVTAMCTVSFSGILLQIFCANGHRKKIWIGDSILLHRGHLTSVVTPLLWRFSLSGRASWRIDQTPLGLGLSFWLF
uniref:Uncharacterized protein n=1 Tax=Brassica oleracea var. oleracea TaxID=109376 RepID=A0A0D3AZD2_BRAOL